MNCLIRIRQRYPSLAASDKKTCRLYSGSAGPNPPSQLTAAGGRSGRQPVQRGEVRAKMGFKGFPALKLALSEALASSRILTLCRYITKFAATIRCVWWVKS